MADGLTLYHAAQSTSPAGPIASAASPSVAAPPAASDTTSTGTIAPLAQYGAIAVGTVYTIGVLIVNLNLGQYGLVSLDLARPEYITTGLLWTVLALAACLGFHRSADSFRSARENGLRSFVGFKSALWVLTASVSPVLVLLPAFGYSLERGAPLWAFFVAVAITAANGVFLHGLGTHLLVLWRDPRRFLNGKAALDVIGLIQAIPATILSIGLFAAVVYPDIPRELGGGRRPQVEVILTDSIEMDWQRAALPYCAARHSVGPVLLLLDGPGSFVIVRIDEWTGLRLFRMPKSTTPLVIDRKHVSAMWYVPRLEGASRIGADACSGGPSGWNSAL